MRSVRNVIGLIAWSMLIGACGGGSTPAPLTLLSSDAALSSVSVTGGTLSPTFSPDFYNYSVTMPFSSSSVTVSATTSDGNASFTINGSNNATVKLAVGDNTISIVVTAEDGTTTRTYTVVVTGLTFTQEAYIKASNTQGVDNDFPDLPGDGFGGMVALSSDGNTLAVRARDEDSAAIGVNGDQTRNDVPDAGAVYVFR